MNKWNELNGIKSIKNTFSEGAFDMVREKEKHRSREEIQYLREKENQIL